MHALRNRCAIVAALLALGGPVALAERAAPHKWRLGTLAPRGFSTYNHLVRLGEEFRKAPDGGVELVLYPDGRMGGEAEMVRRMRQRQLQVGVLTAVGLAEIEPDVSGLQIMPMVFRSLEEFDYVAERVQPKLAERLAQKGFVVLFWGDAGWIRFFSKRPASLPEDLRASKLFVWSGGTREAQMLKSAGFDPVPLETTEILTGLQTNLINAVPMPPVVANAGQVDRLAPHMLAVNWAPLVGAAIVTREAWEKLTPADRSFMLEAASKAGERVRADNRREAGEAVAAMQGRGLRVQEATPEIDAAWRKTASAFWPKIRGTLVPPEIFDEVMRLVEEYRSAPGR